MEESIYYLVKRSDAGLLVREKPMLAPKWGCNGLWEALPTPGDRERSSCFCILSEHFGHWHTIYTRMRDWAKKGVLARVFEALQQEQIIQIKVEAALLDSTSIKVHLDGTGA